VVLMPCDRTVVRQQLRDLFERLLDPAVHSVPQHHLAVLMAMAESLPKALKPTALQVRAPPYFGVDFIPSPTLRDQLISCGLEVSRHFCEEVFNVLDDSSDVGQLIIWGEDPFNEMAWEMSTHVFSRWSWLLGKDWLARANFWRRQRGAITIPEASYFQ
jgi:hypothetical protein